MKPAALHFDKLMLFDQVGANWCAVDGDKVARDAVRLLKNAGPRSVASAWSSQQRGDARQQD